MKICIVGGSGAMAKVALDELSKEPEVERVTIADIDYANAQSTAKMYGDRFAAAHCDANDDHSLISLFRGHDVVMGYVGPFYKFEFPIARAAIRAGVPYCSISDDYDAYLQVSILDAEAKKAGVTILSGLGNSPGITNILAKKGYQSMDNPQRIHVQWTGGSDEEVGPANMQHVMHIFAGTTLQWIDGREVRVKTGRGSKIVDFPDPIGKQEVFYTGHAESVSIPRNLPGLQEVTLHGGVRPVWVAKLATAFGYAGMTTTHKRRARLTKALTPFLGMFTMGDSADKSVFRIDTYGTNEGENCHRVYSGVGPIAFITSIPCVEGALMLGRKELVNPGVHAAESALEPDDFLPRIQKRGVTMFFDENGN